MSRIGVLLAMMLVASSAWAAEYLKDPSRLDSWSPELAGPPRSTLQVDGGTPGGIAPVTNLMTDPSDPASWTLERHGGATAEIRQEDGGLRVDVTRSSSERWHIQLFQPRKALSPGKTYVLRFQVKASTPRKTTIIPLQGANEPWQVFGGIVGVDIATSWKQYTLKFTVNSDASGPMRGPLFQLGDTQGTVWLRNLTLAEAPAASQ